MTKNLKYTEYTRDFPKTLTKKKRKRKEKKRDEGCWQKQSSPNHSKLNPNKRQYNMTRTLVLSTHTHTQRKPLVLQSNGFQDFCIFYGFIILIFGLVVHLFHN